MIRITMNHWLMKSEPEVFSIDDLKKRKRSLWDGVRNYQARNFMRDLMKPGDPILFYHSNANPPGVAGLARVTSTAVPDPTQFDPRSKYHDPKSTKAKPRWFCVEVAFERRWPEVISLSELRQVKALRQMALLKPGQRLSVQPVTLAEFQAVLALAKGSHD